MGSHLKGGQFQSDKYPTCPPGKVPLSVKDPAAQDLLWKYAQRRRVVDAEFADDLETALRAAGYEPKNPHEISVRAETWPEEDSWRADCTCGWWRAGFHAALDAWRVGSAHVFQSVKKEKA